MDAEDAEEVGEFAAWQDAREVEALGVRPNDPRRSAFSARLRVHRVLRGEPLPYSFSRRSTFTMCPVASISSPKGSLVACSSIPRTVFRLPATHALLTLGA